MSTSNIYNPASPQYVASGNESPSLGEGIGVGQFPQDYHGIPFKDIIRKYWEVNNRGFEPTQGDRDTLTYQLACDLRHICGRNFDWLDQVIPCYDGFPLEEKRAKIRSALSSEFNGFPIRLRNVLSSLTPSPSPVGEGSIFNLAGQRVSNPTRGIYVIDGRKVIVK